jgi:mobilome CxxCx(11)CxxC protein
LHEKLGAKCRRWLAIFDFLALLLAVLSLPVRELFPESWRPVADKIWEVIAALVLVLTVVKFYTKWQESAEAHRLGMGKNVQLATEIQALLRRSDISDPEFDAFMRRAADLQEADRAALSVVKETLRQEAYRQATKESPTGEEAVCPKCNASPWSFTPGPCQLCGGSPAVIAPKDPDQ